MYTLYILFEDILCYFRILFSSKFKIIIYLKDVIFWVFMKIFENTVEIISNIDFGKIKKKLVSVRYLKKSQNLLQQYISISIK